MSRASPWRTCAEGGPCLGRDRSSRQESTRGRGVSISSLFGPFGLSGHVLPQPTYLIDEALMNPYKPRGRCPGRRLHEIFEFFPCVYLAVSGR